MDTPALVMRVMNFLRLMGLSSFIAISKPGQAGNNVRVILNSWRKAQGKAGKICIFIGL
jgi:hypothetical protein